MAAQPYPAPCNAVHGYALSMAGKGCILFVPGFKASILVDADTGRPVWLTLGQALAGHSSLAFDRPDLGVRNAHRFRAQGLLERLPILPGIPGLDIHASTMSALRRGAPAGWSVQVFSYDWRADPQQLVQDLDRCVKTLVSDGVRDVRILAHSMGALLTARWLLGPGHTHGAVNSVSRVAFIAGAFRGAARMFRNLQIGDDPTGLNRCLLSAQALGTFPSSYVFIPEAWPFVLDRHGRPLAMDLHDVDLWRTRRWGLFRDGRTAFDAARSAFLEEQLSAGRTFLRKVSDPQATPPSGLRVLNVVGRGQATLHQLIEGSNGLLVLRERERRADPALSALSINAPGDGTLVTQATMLPPAFNTSTVRAYTTDQDHMRIIQRGPALAEAVRFLVD